MYGGMAMLLSLCTSQLDGTSDAVLLYPVVAGNLGVSSHCMGVHSSKHDG